MLLHMHIWLHMQELLTNGKPSHEVFVLELTPEEVWTSASTETAVLVTFMHDAPQHSAAPLLSLHGQVTVVPSSLQ